MKLLRKRKKQKFFYRNNKWENVMKKADIINMVLREYDTKKGVALEKKNKETKKAYEACSELELIDKKINELGLESMRKILNDKENAAALRAEFESALKKLNSQRAKIIQENKINPYYNKPVYECSLCEDSGYDKNGNRCVCFEKRLNELYMEKSQMGTILENADFKNFSLDYYSNLRKDDCASPKEIITEALEYSKKFCEDFDNVTYNLFFYGSTGLGKTFLSAIIAKNVMKKGKDVKYVRATRVFSTYEDYKFKDYRLKGEIDEIYNCDLLVIDDLGTECTNKNNVSFLFDLINDRLINGRKIIINTNLDLSSFSKQYTVRLTSRIYDAFKIFSFEGEDIRIRKLIEG